MTNISFLSRHITRGETGCAYLETALSSQLLCKSKTIIVKKVYSPPQKKERKTAVRMKMVKKGGDWEQMVPWHLL